MSYEQMLSELKGQLESWEKRHAEAFKRERKPESEFIDDDGIPVKRAYTPLDLAERGFDYSKDLGLPGEYPFTRSISPTMYRESLWRISQYMGHETPEDSNKLYKAVIHAGGDMPSFAFDLPTQLGLDPDSPRAEGEVGRVGVSLSSLRDWEIALEGIDLGNIWVSTNLNSTGMIGIATHLVLAEKQGVDLKRLRGSCQNDILKEHAVRGNFIFPPEHGVRLVIDTWSYCAKQAPQFVPSQICSIQYGNSGATRARAVAYGLGDAFAYFQAAVDRGLDIDSFAPRIWFLVGVEHFGFFQWIAKLRAMRKVYARQMKKRFKPQNVESLMVRLRAAQGGTSLTRQHYLANVGRGAIACLAAALGGVDQFKITPYGEQFGIATQEEVLTAVALHHVVGLETGVVDTVDPMAGSYFVESLTMDFEERITKELETVDRRGGMMKCIEDGYVQRMVAADYYRWYRALESGKLKRVGVNFWVTEEDQRPTKIYRADPDAERQRIEAVRELRRKRDNSKAQRALSEVKATAVLPSSEENNLMPAIMEAVGAYATIGEICDSLREVWGEWKEPRMS